MFSYISLTAFTLFLIFNPLHEFETRGRSRLSIRERSAGRAREIEIDRSSSLQLQLGTHARKIQMRLIG